MAKRTSNEQNIEQAFEHLLDNLGLLHKYNETRLIAYWADVVGKMIEKHTGSMYVKNHELYVHIESAPLRNELLMARSKLVKKLNMAVGSEVISDIVFL